MQYTWRRWRALESWLALGRCMGRGLRWSVRWRLLFLLEEDLAGSGGRGRAGLVRGHNCRTLLTKGRLMRRRSLCLTRRRAWLVESLRGRTLIGFTPRWAWLVKSLRRWSLNFAPRRAWLIKALRGRQTLCFAPWWVWHTMRWQARARLVTPERKVKISQYSRINLVDKEI